MAPGPARRHLHPAAGAHVARLPRAGARRGGRPVPRRDELARLQQPRGPRPPDDAARRRRFEQHARAGRRRCGRRCSAAATTTCSRTTSSTAAAGTSPRRCPTTLPGRRSGRRRDALPRASCTTQRVWSTPSELLERIVRERAVIEVGALTGRFRDVARRVRFLVDQARAYADAVGGTLRDYLAWAELQGAEGARVVEAVVPETDDDAVRIMTIHGAKGLEFPIVVCSGMTTAAQTASRGVRGAVPARGRLRGEDREGRADRGVRAAQADRRADGLPREAAAALRRVHPRPRPSRRLGAPQGARRSSPTIARTGRTPSCCGRRRERRAVVGAGAAAAGAPGRRRRPRSRRARARARARRVAGGVRPRALARGNRRGVRLGHHARAPPRRRAGPRRGRRSRSRQGRAATSSCRRGTRAATAPRSAGRCTPRCRPSTSRPGAGIDGDRGRAGRGRRRARARGDDRGAGPRRAREPDGAPRRGACRIWRETYVAVPFDGITLEGYVDLVFRDDDGLVVVDYKTDAVDAETRAERIAHYRIQAAAYALAVARGDRRAGRPRRALLPRPGRARPRSSSRAPISQPRSPRSAALLAAERDDPSPPPPLVPVRRLSAGASPGARGPPCAILFAPVKALKFCLKFLVTVAVGGAALAGSLALLGPAASPLAHATTPIGQLERHDQRARGPLARLRPQRQRDGDARDRGPLAGEAEGHPAGPASTRSSRSRTASSTSTTASTGRARRGRCSRTSTRAASPRADRRSPSSW